MYHYLFLSILLALLFNTIALRMAVAAINLDDANNSTPVSITVDPAQAEVIEINNIDDSLVVNLQAGDIDTDLSDYIVSDSNFFLIKISLSNNATFDGIDLTAVDATFSLQAGGVGFSDATYYADAGVIFTTTDALNIRFSNIKLDENNSNNENNDITIDVIRGFKNGLITDGLNTSGILVNVLSKPGLSRFTSSIAPTLKNTEVELTLAELKAQGDQFDNDGTVDAFVVQSVPSGLLKIGTTSITASAFIVDSNDTIDINNKAYWTPDPDVLGLFNAINIKAQDNDTLLSSSSALAQINVVPLTIITNVSASDPDGVYIATDRLNIRVELSDIVTVTGTPQLILETGSSDAIINYSSGSGSNTLNFTYTVATGQHTLNLDYQSNAALILNGATIQNSTGFDVILTLANPSTSGSLASNKTLIINHIPSFTHFANIIDKGTVNTDFELTFNQLNNQANAVDSDGGTINAFVVQNISSGNLKIGNSISNATAFIANSNDRIDADNHAYWTADQTKNGVLTAFTVKAEDNNGSLSATAVAVQINIMVAPIAAFTATVISNTAPWQVTLDGSFSTDPDGSVLSYQWSSINATETTATGKTAQFTFAKEGEVNINLRVTDAQGLSHTTTEVITILAAAIHDLNITIIGNGTITIYADNALNIVCNNDCNNPYVENTLINLIPTADDGFNFKAWGGDCASENSNANIIIDSPKNCTITFAATTTSAVCEYTVTADKKLYHSDTKIGEITVKTADNCPWKVTNNPNNIASWITLITENDNTINNSGNGRIAYKIATNNQPQQRKAKIVIADQTITLTQAGAIPELYFPKLMPIYGTGDTLDISISGIHIDLIKQKKLNLWVFFKEQKSAWIFIKNSAENQIILSDKPMPYQQIDITKKTELTHSIISLAISDDMRGKYTIITAYLALEDSPVQTENCIDGSKVCLKSADIRRNKFQSTNLGKRQFIINENLCGNHFLCPIPVWYQIKDNESRLMIKNLNVGEGYDLSLLATETTNLDGASLTLQNLGKWPEFSKSLKYSPQNCFEGDRHTLYKDPHLVMASATGLNKIELAIFNPKNESGIVCKNSTLKWDQTIGLFNSFAWYLDID